MLKVSLGMNVFILHIRAKGINITAFGIAYAMSNVLHRYANDSCWFFFFCVLVNEMLCCLTMEVVSACAHVVKYGFGRKSDSKCILIHFGEVKKPLILVNYFWGSDFYFIESNSLIPHTKLDCDYVKIIFII